LAYSLARPRSYGIEGLAIAQSVVAAVEVVILMSIMLFRDKKLFTLYFWGGVWRIISVTGFSVVACFIMISLYPLGFHDRGVVTLGSKLLLISSVTFAVHVGVSALFDLEEARPVLKRAKEILFKPVKVEV
jgi:hypothetical protein